MRVIIVLFILTYGIAAIGGELVNNPIEVGDVRWGRDLDSALTNSAETGKPVLVLFQEVPGCSGVQEFGREVLKNPSIVEAMENEFYPVLVYNNKSGGMDEKLLKRYQEPSWNYQVIRFLDAKGRDIIPRKDRIWTTRGVASRMIEALNASDRQIPPYLQALAKDGY